MADNFRSMGAFKAWVWSYVPVVGGASAWSTIVFLMVMHFVASCVEQFAQSQASYEHNKELMQVLAPFTRPAAHLVVLFLWQVPGSQCRPMHLSSQSIKG